jgi:hypothetical protein
VPILHFKKKMDKNNAKYWFSLVILSKIKKICAYYSIDALSLHLFNEMATHKLDLGDFDEIDYYLIAIHRRL